MGRWHAMQRSGRRVPSEPLVFACPIQSGLNTQVDGHTIALDWSSTFDPPLWRAVLWSPNTAGAAVRTQFLSGEARDHLFDDVPSGMYTVSIEPIDCSCGELLEGQPVVVV